LARGILGAKHWIFQVDAEVLERMEKTIDMLQKPLGLDPNESARLGSEQRQESGSS
jgi:hypothetical protein